MDWDGRYNPPDPSTLHSTAPIRTDPHHEETLIAQPAPPSIHDREQDLLRAAFRDLHGARLHGFALLVSLGDRRRAAGVAASVLATGARQAGELRHPERAAAWLRARAWRRLRNHRQPRAASLDRREALRAIGTGDAAFAGLSALTLGERTALVAGSIERLQPADLQLVLGTDAAGSHRLLKRARKRYLATVRATQARREQPAEGVPGAGGLAVMVDGIASRTIGERAPQR